MLQKEKNNADLKTERILKTLSFEIPDRIPVAEFYWPQFVEKWRKEKNLSEDVDIFDYYDVDLKNHNC